MEQRPLRVGDNVDDYCPRERRITSHVIVALVDTAIRQTRCATCDSEHVFKAGLSPRPRRRDEAVVAGPATNGTPVPTPEPVPAARAATDDDRHATTVAGADAVDGNRADAQPDSPGNDLWSGHRRLIRATLPRVDGNEPPPRAIPEFTMHQRHPRGGGQPFRGGGHGQPWHERNGNHNHGPNRHRHGAPFSNGNGNANGNGPSHQGHDNHDQRDQDEADGNVVGGNNRGPGGHGRGRRRRRRGGGHRKPQPQ